MNDRWINDREALHATADMLTSAGWLDTAQDVVYFLEKPWKWQEQRDLWIAAGSPTPGSDAWQLLVKRLDRDDVDV